jgi:hypothetical protein
VEAGEQDSEVEKKSSPRLVDRSTFEQFLVAKTGEPLDELVRSHEEREAERIERFEARQENYLDNEHEAPRAQSCGVTPASIARNEEESEELKAQASLRSYPAPPPGFREAAPMPSVEDMVQLEEPIQVTRPSFDLLERQAEYFAGRERATFDLSGYRAERSQRLSSEIASTHGKTPGEMLNDLERRELSFEAIEAIAQAEANRADYDEKYEVLGRFVEPR